MSHDITRRKALQKLGAGLGLAGLVASDALNPGELLAQAPSQKMKPEGWPTLSDEEKELLQIPLSNKEALELLNYKVDAVLDNDAVTKHLKTIGLIPNIPFIILTDALGL